MKIEIIVGGVFEQEDVEAIVSTDRLENSGGLFLKTQIIEIKETHYENSAEPERNMMFAINSALDIASNNGIRTLAMPTLGVGMFKFPILLAAKITARTIKEYKSASTSLEVIRICASTEGVRHLYESAFAYRQHLRLPSTR